MVFGVFDGHGGKEVAEYARDHFIRILKSAEPF
jgi:serine/threonine protein phosphatase PrpC